MDILNWKKHVKIFILNIRFFFVIISKLSKKLLNKLINFSLFKIGGTFMSNINNSSIVKKQYENASNLNTRISIHDKYSTNKMGFGNWIFSNYRIEDGMSVLELGCGTGDMWINKEHEIKLCSKLVLSDFSEGMVDVAKNNLNMFKNIEYKVIDIQDIPFESNKFDIVIANMMLYHVPDIEKGLNEVQRILKDNGTFYCATYGEHGIIEYLSKILYEYGVKDTVNKNFTLQNGGEILEKKFSAVKKLEYKDSLAVTSADDMIEYIYSLASMTTLNEVPREKIKEILVHNMVNGILNVPKEYGMFVCKK